MGGVNKGRSGSLLSIMGSGSSLLLSIAVMELTIDNDSGCEWEIVLTFFALTHG